MSTVNDISYSIHHSALDIDYGVPLTAKTDLGARRQAARIARENGLRGYTIRFFRKSDGCHGWIDA